MALAALAPLLGSVLTPAAADAVGLGISPLLASSIGSGLGTWAATGNPLTGHVTVRALVGVSLRGLAKHRRT